MQEYVGTSWKPLTVRYLLQLNWMQDQTYRLSAATFKLWLYDKTR